MASQKRRKRRPNGSAWHRSFDNCWYYTPKGEKLQRLLDEGGEAIRGKENREKAELALARVKLQLKPKVSSSEWTVARVCGTYLEHVANSVAKETMSQRHYESSHSFLNDLCAYCGALKVNELTKGHIKRWVERHNQWKSPSTINKAIGLVKATFNYCVEWHDLESNPIASYKKPKSRARITSFTPDDEQTIYDNIDQAFADFIKAGILTGLRTYSELAQVTADDVIESDQGMAWRVRTSKRKGGAKEYRIVPLLPEMEVMTRRLMSDAPTGSGLPLLRTSRRKKWTRGNGVQRFFQLRKKLGWGEDPIRKEYSLYTGRHTFAHRILTGYYTDQPCTIETLAALMGNTPKVCYDHYAKQWDQHYSDPLWAAMGKSKTKRAS